MGLFLIKIIYYINKITLRVQVVPMVETIKPITENIWDKGETFEEVFHVILAKLTKLQ